MLTELAAIALFSALQTLDGWTTVIWSPGEVIAVYPYSAREIARASEPGYDAEFGPCREWRDGRLRDLPCATYYQRHLNYSGHDWAQPQIRIYVVGGIGAMVASLVAAYRYRRFPYLAAFGLGYLGVGQFLRLP